MTFVQCESSLNPAWFLRPCSAFGNYCVSHKINSLFGYKVVKKLWIILNIHNVLIKKEKVWPAQDFENIQHCWNYNCIQEKKILLIQKKLSWTSCQLSGGWPYSLHWKDSMKLNSIWKHHSRHGNVTVQSHVCSCWLIQSQFTRHKLMGPLGEDAGNWEMYVSRASFSKNK